MKLRGTSSSWRPSGHLNFLRFYFVYVSNFCTKVNNDICVIKGPVGVLYPQRNYYYYYLNIIL